MNISAGTARGVPSPQPVALNLDEAIERMGDKEIYLEIARYFASHLEQTLNNLAAALTEGRMEDATRLAHSLKGNCATVGADALREECFTLEQLCRAEDLEHASAAYKELAPKLLALRAFLNSL